MKLEVLVATMHQSDFSLLTKLNIKTDALIVNQCDKNSYTEFEYNGSQIKWIDTTQRGLSRSRNMALSYATGDICLLADDDISYVDNYETIVLEAFEQQDVDIIAFNIYLDNVQKEFLHKNAKVNKKAPRHSYYGSVRLAFKLQKMQKFGLQFNVLFGAGAQYSAGEESLFLRKCRKHKLVIHENKEYILHVDCAQSSWFKGFNEKYYFDKGVFLAAAYGRQAWIYKYYFLFQSRKLSTLSTHHVNKCLNAGICEFFSI